MWRISTSRTLLILFLVLLLCACVPLRTLGREVRIDARTPEILLPGPYNPPEKVAELLVSNSDYLRDLQIEASKEAGKEPTQIMSTSDILRGVY